MTSTILTPQGLKKLKIELQNLKNTKRKEIKERIKSAKEYGDLSENAEYQDAKKQQSFVEGRIQELERMTKKAKIVDMTKDITKVDIGDKVTIKLKGQTEIYQIVGATESDPATGKISFESPIAHALLGHKVGEAVKFPTPDGTMDCKILKIE